MKIAWSFLGQFFDKKNRRSIISNFQNQFRLEIDLRQKGSRWSSFHSFFFPPNFLKNVVKCLGNQNKLIICKEYQNSFEKKKTNDDENDKGDREVALSVVTNRQ